MLYVTLSMLMAGLVLLVWAVYELFLAPGVCQGYARRFMRPVAVDVEDVSAYKP